MMPRQMRHWTVRPVGRDNPHITRPFHAVGHSSREFQIQSTGLDEGELGGGNVESIDIGGEASISLLGSVRPRVMALSKFGLGYS